MCQLYVPINLYRTISRGSLILSEIHFTISLMVRKIGPTAFFFAICFAASVEVQASRRVSAVFPSLVPLHATPSRSYTSVDCTFKNIGNTPQVLKFKSPSIAADPANLIGNNLNQMVAVSADPNEKTSAPIVPGQVFHIGWTNNSAGNGYPYFEQPVMPSLEITVVEDRGAMLGECFWKSWVHGGNYPTKSVLINGGRPF